MYDYLMSSGQESDLKVEQSAEIGTYQIRDLALGIQPCITYGIRSRQ